MASLADIIYPMTEINKYTDSKWCSIHNTKTHDTAESKVYI